MAPRRKIIIDTDPGVDDLLALLLLFSAHPDELEILLVSLTFGNVEVSKCLRNVMTLFFNVEKDIEWRRQNGQSEGFESLRVSKPLVAVGAEEPLADQRMMADYFHGIDGVGNTHATHPHLTPAETWKSLFDSSKDKKSPEDAALNTELTSPDALWRPSQDQAHKEILRLLRENENDTVTIVAIGPLTNIALAAAEDPETFLRVKEVVVMGGTINEPGNVKSPPPPIRPPSPQAPSYRLTKAPSTPLRISLNLRNQITPVAEFNTYADSVATARVYALTSSRPNSTLPPAPPAPPGQRAEKAPPPFLAQYPDKLSRQLNVTLFPLDITSSHEVTRKQFSSAVEPLVKQGSPLAAWTSAFMKSTFEKIESLTEGVSGDAVGLALHDPLCVWYALTGHSAGWKIEQGEDIRVETSGQWTRGMCVVDRRSRRRRDADDEEGERPGDTGNWLSASAGNRVNRCVQTPGEESFAPFLLKRVFGL